MKQWILTFEIALESYAALNASINYGFELSKQKLDYMVTTGVQNIVLGSIVVPDSMITLWWPAGYGEQKLYNAFVRDFFIDQIRVQNW